MGIKDPYYLLYLKDLLSSRIANNSSYSLRSFARSIDVDASHLSKILNKKKVISLEMAKKIVLKLQLDKSKADEFLLSASEEIRCKDLRKVAPHLTDCENETEED